LSSLSYLFLFFQRLESPRIQQVGVFHSSESGRLLVSALPSPPFFFIHTVSSFPSCFLLFPFLSPSSSVIVRYTVSIQSGPFSDPRANLQNLFPFPLSLLFFLHRYPDIFKADFPFFPPFPFFGTVSVLLNASSLLFLPFHQTLPAVARTLLSFSPPPSERVSLFSFLFPSSVFPRRRYSFFFSSKR